MSEDNPSLTEPVYSEIWTERLKLRTLRVEDAEGLMPILTSKEVMQWTTAPPAQNLSQAERWIKDRALGQDVFNFTVELRYSHDSSIVGSSNAAPIIGVAGTFHVPKIGYLIHPDYWGKGIASEALEALVPAIFDRFASAAEGGLDYLEGWIDVENVASRRVLEKGEFVLCEEMDAGSGAPQHVARVAVLRRAREGKSLEGMGLVAGKGGKGGEDGRPMPPIQ